MAMLARSVQTSKLKFSAPKTLSNQGRTVYINYEGDKLRVQTPIMFLPYGVGDNEKLNAKKQATDEVQAKRYDLNVSFRGMDGNPKLQELHDKMQEIEKRVIEEAFENRVLWLQDDYDGNKKFVEKLFHPIVKYDKNKETGKIEGRYPPTMKLKLPYDAKTDTFNFECEDMDGNELDFKGVMKKLKGAKARLIIQLNSVWFSGSRYGCTWKVLRAKFEVTSQCQVSFLDDSDDEVAPTRAEDEIDAEEDAIALANDDITPPKKLLSGLTLKEKEKTPPPPPPKAEKAEKVNVEVSESESEAEEDAAAEEADSESDDDPTPPPPPPPVTKTRKTTKKSS